MTWSMESLTFLVIFSGVCLINSSLAVMLFLGGFESLFSCALVAVFIFSCSLLDSPAVANACKRLKASVFIAVFKLFSITKPRWRGNRNILDQIR